MFRFQALRCGAIVDSYVRLQPKCAARNFTHQLIAMDARKCRESAAALQIAALSAAFEKLQSTTVRNLERKLEDTTVDLERARMEREDFRQGGGPSDVWRSPGSCSDTSLLQDTFAEVRDLLDIGEIDEARQILNDALPGSEPYDPDARDSEAEDADADAAVAAVPLPGE